MRAPSYISTPRDCLSERWSDLVRLLANADVPFLQGRAFVFASQFSELLPTQLAKQYLDAAISVLDSADASVPVKVSAVRALTK